MFDLTTCRVCGCTDDDCSACIEASGHPCHWVAGDLCSRCCDEALGAQSHALAFLRMLDQVVGGWTAELDQEMQRLGGRERLKEVIRLLAAFDDAGDAGGDRDWECEHCGAYSGCSHYTEVESASRRGQPAGRGCANCGAQLLVEDLDAAVCPYCGIA